MEKEQLLNSTPVSSPYLKDTAFKKKKVRHSLKDAWYVLRYSVLFRITYEIENLIILTDNLDHFVPKGIFQKLLKRVLRSKKVYNWLKRVRILLLKKITFDSSIFLRKKTTNDFRLSRKGRKQFEKMSKDDIADSLKRAYDVQRFLNKSNSKNFVEECQTILSEKSR